jgi:hypothetical protein
VNFQFLLEGSEASDHIRRELDDARLAEQIAVH